MTNAAAKEALMEVTAALRQRADDVQADKGAIALAIDLRRVARKIDDVVDDINQLTEV